MITERHKSASRQVVAALEKGTHGANVFYTDIGSTAKLAQGGIYDRAIRTLPD
jgi:hypothetical protein